MTILYIFLLLIIVPAAIFIGGIQLYFSVLKKAPIEKKIKEIKEKENYVPLDDISANLQFIIMILEDSIFWEHNGYRIKRMLYAFHVNMKSRRKRMGGSTITQQLAKNMYFSFKKSYRRKAAEILMAVTLEKKLSKEEILEAYFNIIYYGNKQYGIMNACRFYFEKTPKHLSMNEALTIGALLPAPNKYHPLVEDGLFLQARKIALNKMVKKGILLVRDTDTFSNSAYNEVMQHREAMIYEQLYRILLMQTKRNKQFKISDMDGKMIEALFAEPNRAETFMSHVISCSQRETKYVFGAIMEQIDDEMTKRLASLYPHWYTKEKRKELSEKKGTYGCDCSGLIKSYFFQLNRERYCNLLDLNSFMMLEAALVKGEIDTLAETPGLCLFMPGHVGVYAGNQEVIEATSNEEFGDGVVKTKLGDREWTHWFQCPFIVYDT